MDAPARSDDPDRDTTSDPSSTTNKLGPNPVGSCGLVPRRLVKLTPAQIANSLEALVPGAGADAVGLASTIALARDEFSNSARRLELPESHVEALLTAAEKVATRALQNMAGLASCLPASINDDTCIKAFISDFGARAFRRPLDTAEADSFMDFFKKEATARGRSVGVDQVLQAFLVSPNFLFRTELGSGMAGSTSLSSPERASALSYFLTEGPPSSALMLAANRNELSTKAQIENQARKILTAGASSARGLLQFFQETFRSEDVLGIAKDPKLFPMFNRSLATAMAREPMEFIQNLLWKDDASFSKLYTANYSIVNSDLAKLYGATGPSSSSTYVKTMMPEGKRAGILTQASFLARYATATSPDIVNRGKFVRTQLLCQVLPPPPMMVAIPPPRPGLTARQNLEMNHVLPACSTCHSLMDPLGFAFEHYDAIGAWRNSDGGKPIDSSGKVNGVEGGPLPFSDAVELGKLMSTMPEAQQCLFGQLYSYGSGQRYATDVQGDECRQSQLLANVKNANGNLIDALAAMVSNDDFFLRTN